MALEMVVIIIVRVRMCEVIASPDRGEVRLEAEEGAGAVVDGAVVDVAPLGPHQVRVLGDQQINSL